MLYFNSVALRKDLLYLFVDLFNLIVQTKTIFTEVGLLQTLLYAQLEYHDVLALLTIHIQSISLQLQFSNRLITKNQSLGLEIILTVPKGEGIGICNDNFSTFRACDYIAIKLDHSSELNLIFRIVILKISCIERQIEAFYLRRKVKIFKGEFPKTSFFEFEQVDALIFDVVVVVELFRSILVGY